MFVCVCESPVVLGAKRRFSYSVGNSRRHVSEEQVLKAACLPCLGRSKWLVCSGSVELVADSIWGRSLLSDSASARSSLLARLLVWLAFHLPRRAGQPPNQCEALFSLSASSDQLELVSLRDQICTSGDPTASFLKFPQSCSSPTVPKLGKSKGRKIYHRALSGSRPARSLASFFLPKIRSTGNEESHFTGPWHLSLHIASPGSRDRSLAPNRIKSHPRDPDRALGPERASLFIFWVVAVFNCFGPPSTSQRDGLEAAATTSVLEERRVAIWPPVIPPNAHLHQHHRDLLLAVAVSAPCIACSDGPRSL